MNKTKETVNEKKIFKVVELYIMGISERHISIKLNISLEEVKKITKKLK